MKINPKIAYVDMGDIMEDFLEEWEGNHNRAPTQKDYEKWLKQQLFTTVRDGCISLDCIKVTDVPK